MHILLTAFLPVLRVQRLYVGYPYTSRLGNPLSGPAYQRGETLIFSRMENTTFVQGDWSEIFETYVNKKTALGL